ncbi:MAG: PspC protein [Haloplasmataceae bacterium]|jgi:phage shock protein PspC (stress-responsive transcriptional regulator)|nr:PspC protein [Haloplasmataceae bacterium]
MDKKLTKSNSNRVIAGICGGMGEYFNIDATLVRVAWVFFALLGGSGILAYLICALIIPNANN